MMTDLPALVGWQAGMREEGVSWEWWAVSFWSCAHLGRASCEGAWVHIAGPEPDVSGQSSAQAGPFSAWGHPS